MISFPCPLYFYNSYAWARFLSELPQILIGSSGYKLHVCKFVVPNQEKQNCKKVSFILNCLLGNHIKLEG